MTRTGTVVATVAVIAAVSIVVEVVAETRGVAPAVAANAVGATTAAIANFWVAVARKRLRVLRVVTGVLGSIYAVMLWGQIAGAFTAEQRVIVGTWIGPSAWVAVWIVPPLLALLGRLVPTPEEIAGAVVEQLRTESDE